MASKEASNIVKTSSVLLSAVSCCLRKAALLLCISPCTRKVGSYRIIPSNYADGVSWLLLLPALGLWIEVGMEKPLLLPPALGPMSPSSRNGLGLDHLPANFQVVIEDSRVPLVWQMV